MWLAALLTALAPASVSAVPPMRSAITPPPRLRTATSSPHFSLAHAFHRTFDDDQQPCEMFVNDTDRQLTCYKCQLQLLPVSQCDQLGIGLVHLCDTPHGHFNGSVCTCMEGWTGASCQVPICEHGKPLIDECDCQMGYAGKHCNHSVCDVGQLYKFSDRTYGCCCVESDEKSCQFLDCRSEPVTIESWYRVCRARFTKHYNFHHLCATIKSYAPQVPTLWHNTKRAEHGSILAQISQWCFYTFVLLIGTTIFCGLCNMRTQAARGSKAEYKQVPVAESAIVAEPGNASPTLIDVDKTQPLNNQAYVSYSQSEDCLTVDTDVSQLNSLSTCSNMVPLNALAGGPQRQTWMVMGRGVTTSTTSASCGAYTEIR